MLGALVGADVAMDDWLDVGKSVGRRLRNKVGAQVGNADGSVVLVGPAVGTIVVCTGVGLVVGKECVGLIELSALGC